MSVYRVGYDLNKPGQNYDELIDALSKVGKRILKSDWIVDVDQTAIQLREAVKSYLDRGDHVVVTEITDAADWATYALTNNPGVALLKRLRP
ncbi:MAG: hypothetical protein NVV62_10490 [Terricaulis sp.]|nr:hypothetical protein [Terricaulis sp.]